MRGFIEKDGGERKDFPIASVLFVCFSFVKTMPANVTALKGVYLQVLAFQARSMWRVNCNLEQW